MFQLIFFGAILLTINAKVNITCYECNGCKSTPTNISIDNRICFRIQITCPAEDIHTIDLRGDRLQANYSLANCGQTRVYKSPSVCTIVYHCCYTDKCNTYENPLLLSSSSSVLFILKQIVISSNILFIYHWFSL